MWWCQHSQPQSDSSTALPHKAFFAFPSPHSFENLIREAQAADIQAAMLPRQQLSMPVGMKPAPQDRKADNTSPVRGTVRRYHLTKSTSSLPVNVLTLVNSRSSTNDVPFTPKAKTRRKQATVLPPDDLPPEAAELKRRIWNSHPMPAYKFRLGKMKRMAVPPVEIPPNLADPSALEHMVAGKSIPMTKSMWQQQRYLFKMRRLPCRISEGCAY